MALAYCSPVRTLPATLTLFPIMVSPRWKIPSAVLPRSAAACAGTRASPNPSAFLHVLGGALLPEVCHHIDAIGASESGAQTLLVIEVRLDDFGASCSEGPGARGTRVTCQRPDGEPVALVGKDRLYQASALGAGRPYYRDYLLV